MGGVDHVFLSRFLDLPLHSVHTMSEFFTLCKLETMQIHFLQKLARNVSGREP